MTTRRGQYLAKWLALILCSAWPGRAVENGLARTPPMGWNSWNFFGMNATEAKVKAVADSFVSKGLKDAGYRYIVVDDGWLQASRDAKGNLVPVASQFPSGMKALADYVHSNGLKFGLYGSPTKTTCGNRAGSYNHETQDAQTFASWGIDFYKYDWCGVQSGEDAGDGVPVAEVQRRYVAMRDAIYATKQPIVFSLCEKGQGTHGVLPGSWQDTVGNMWRIGLDINRDWNSTPKAYTFSITGHIDQNADLSDYAKPGGWNDPDMLQVGNITETNMTVQLAENRSHFSMWCMMASPLFLGNDPSKMSDDISAIVTNREAIAIDQDSLGHQGIRIKGKGALEVWVKLLKNGDKGVAFFNRTAAAATISVQWTDSLIDWPAESKVDVRDLWKHTDSLGVANGISAKVPTHDVAMFRLKNPNPSGAKSRTPRNDGIAVGRIHGTMGIYVPFTGNPGRAQFTDLHGRRLFSMPIHNGWNFPSAALHPNSVYLVRFTFPDRTYAVHFHTL